MVRRGFTLVAVLVAVVILGIGVLGAMATTTLAARHLREAHARQAAVRVASMVLDSLVQHPSPVAGERSEGPHRLRWTVESAGPASAVDLVVEYADGTRHHALHFEALHLAPLPVLEVER